MEDQISGLPTWITAGIVSIIGALGSAVVFMFRLGRAETEKMIEQEQKRHTALINRLIQDSEKQQARIVDCEQDRQTLRVDLAKLELKVELLAERADGRDK